MMSVTVPVADEKLPIKAEYEFGSGKACFNFAFQLTSTMLIHMPIYFGSKTSIVSWANLCVDAKRESRREYEVWVM